MSLRLPTKAEIEAKQTALKLQYEEDLQKLSNTYSTTVRSIRTTAISEHRKCDDTINLNEASKLDTLRDTLLNDKQTLRRKLDEDLKKAKLPLGV